MRKCLDVTEVEEWKCEKEKKTKRKSCFQRDEERQIQIFELKIVVVVQKKRDLK